MWGDTAPRSTRLSVLIPFAIVTLIWGSTWLVIKDQLHSVPPSWSVTYRFAVAGAAMLVWAKMRKERLGLDARGIGFAAVLGITQFVLNYNFVYVSEQYITSGVVAVVYALLLVPNAILARLFLGQRMGTQLTIGSAIAIAGVGLLFVHEARLDGIAAGTVTLGIGIAFAGLLFASIANVMQGTRTSKAYPMATMLGWAMLIGAALDGAWSLATVGPPMFDTRPAYVIGILYLGVFGSAIAFNLYFRLIQEIGPTKAAYTGVAIPVIAMILSTLFEGYRWSWIAAAGSALALAGLVVALKARRPNR